MPNEDASIILPEPRIITLRRYTRESIRQGPELAVYWKHSELFPPSPTDSLERIYLDHLMMSDSRAQLGQFAYANNLLLATEQLGAEPQKKLAALFLSGSVREAISRYVSEHGPNEPHNRLVFHRPALLLNMKLILGIREDLLRGSQESNLAGALTLLANEFLGHEEDEINDRTMLLESVSNWEVYNLRDVAYSMARYDLLIRKYLEGDDPQVVSLRGRLAIDSGRFDGLPLDEYHTFIFAIYSLIHSQAAGSLTENNVHAGMCSVSASNLSESLNIAPAAVTQFFESRATTPERFCNDNAGGGWTEEQVLSYLGSDRFITDITSIRQRPFLKLDEDNFLALDISLVLELVTTGLFWKIHESLPPKPSRDRDTFFELWGRVFELYTVDLMRHYYPSTSSIDSPFMTNVIYEDGGEKVEIDALLCSGPNVILFEVKSPLMRLDVRCGRSWDAFESEIHMKFVENQAGQPKGVRQLARAATAISNGALPSCSTPSQIFPVLICADKAMECFGMNRYLNQVFQGCFVSKPHSIRPLIIISIDELELILPAIAGGHIAWQELLNSRFQGDEVNAFSVHQAFYDIQRDSPIDLRNEYLQQRFEEIWLRIQNQCGQLRSDG